jgi:hypothetical protein
MKRIVLALFLSLVVIGCGDSTAPVAPPVTEISPQAPPTNPPPAAAAPAPATAPQEAGFIHATVKVVDLAGNPLAGVAPIVTRQPNAFDKPVAMGDPTDAAGMGTIRFENAEHLFLRAWDPTLDYFPNNFYEVLPGGSNVEETLTIQMVGSSGLEAQLLLPDGQPAANQTVALMLSHATRGPWWPAQSTTDAEGAVKFPHLPAGEFVLSFKVTAGAQLEVRETTLPPGGNVNLGALALR